MGTPDAAANYLASRELVTPRRLREFFAPESIVMVGASDNSGWGRFIVTSCQTTGFGGPLMAGLPLLRGARGTQPANLDATPGAIARLGDTALSLNGALRALEVNPLWVNGDQVEALDVLVITEMEPST